MGFQGQQIVLDEWMDVGSGGCNAITAAACYNGNVNTFHMVAHWRMNENSGDRVDSAPKTAFLPFGVSPQNLGFIGGSGSLPGATAGILSQAALFVRASSNVARSGGFGGFSWPFQDFTVAGWIKPTSFTGTQCVIAHMSWHPASSIFGPWAIFSESGELRFYITPLGGSPSFTALPLVLGEWQFFVAWHDSSDDKIYLEIDNDAQSSLVWTQGVVSTNPQCDFFVGHDRGFGGSNGDFLDAALDSMSIWGRTLTSAERQLLYNDGAGLDFPFSF